MVTYYTGTGEIHEVTLSGETLDAVISVMSEDGCDYLRAVVGDVTVWSYEGISFESAERSWELRDAELESMNRASDVAVVKCIFVSRAGSITIRYKTTPRVATDIIRRRETDDYDPIGDLTDVLSAETTVEGWIIAQRNIDKLTFDKAVMSHGSSLAVAITSEAKSMGLGRGDKVRVTIERI